MKSVVAILVISLIWILAGTIYYPKWNKFGTEAAITWDVSGYYHYLPAIFIYKDIRQQAWKEEINIKYLTSPANDQSFLHPPSGNKVNKYPIGQSILFSPFFFVAHAYASLSKAYPADGYSKPYQFAIWFGGLLISVLGLVLLRKILLYYFTDETTAWTLLALGIATHWLEYAAISNGMTHTWLFTLLCGLILFSRKFYHKPDWFSAIGIGLTLGFAGLTRPTELIWALIPLLWNIRSIEERIQFLLAHRIKCLISIAICVLIISIQLIYWKYAADEWLVYSYGEQKFNWFRLKISRALFGPNVGWWVYTPIMLLGMAGWISLFKKLPSLFWGILITSVLAIYITISWGHWETGGGLGQRNLIQMYPLLAFPLACVIDWFVRHPVRRWIWIGIFSLNVYYSLWWVHQAHHGGFFRAGQMTKPFFFAVAGRWQPDRDQLKLLDTDEFFKGEPSGVELIYQNDFENDSISCHQYLPDSTIAACLNKDIQFLGPYLIQLTPDCNEWIRLEGDFTVITREWEMWKYAQWIVQFYNGEAVVKTNFIRLHRLIPTDQTSTHIYFDVKVPEEKYDRCQMLFWNAESQHTIHIDNVKVSCFQN